jgi:hypothetical protein
MAGRRGARRSVDDEAGDWFHPADGRHCDVDEPRWLAGQAVQLGRGLVAQRRARPGS